MPNAITRRIKALFRRNELDSELDDELSFHIEKEVEKNIALGLSPAAARRAAMRSFGGVEKFKEEARDVRGIRFFEDLVKDIRYGLRMMIKTPVFTLTAVLSLALGIGANTALFSVTYAVLLKTLPVRESDRLVLLQWQASKQFRTTGTVGYRVPFWPQGMYGSSSFQPQIYERMKAKQGAFSTILAFAEIWGLNIQFEGNAETANGQIVTGEYFNELGVPAYLGRTIVPDDDRAGATPVLMLSYKYWQDRFNSDRAVIGKPLKVNGFVFTIVGVTPSQFNGTLQVDAHPSVTIPMEFRKEVTRDHPLDDKPGKPGPWWMFLMGKLNPGATIEQARAELNPIFQETAVELMPPPHGEKDAPKLEPKDYPTLLAMPGNRGMVEARQEYSTTIYLLFGVAGLVLLIACANVANLLLARSTLRSAEVTIRLAVGAGRRRLIRQLLTESILLSVIAGALGLLFAAWGIAILASMDDKRGALLPSGINYGINWYALAFTFGVAALTGLVFGLAPAWRATKQDLTTSLKEWNRNSSGLSRSRLSKLLVMVQVAVSLLLLITAGLFIRTLTNLQKVNVGFNQERLLTFFIRPTSAGYDEDHLVPLYSAIFEKLDAIPGILSASFGNVPLIAHYSSGTGLILPGESAKFGGDHFTNLLVVRENYFSTFEIPIIRGRAFDQHDTEAGAKVAIISDSVAKQYFPGDDPIGKMIGYDEKTEGRVQIVGIARDIKYNSQSEHDQSLLYVPWRQAPSEIGSMSYAVRTSGDPAAIVPAVRNAIRSVDDNLPLNDVATQTEVAASTLNQELLFARLMTFFALLVTLLSAIGLYGVMAYSVAQRTSEIGIRMALGARGADVLRLILWQGLKLVLIGLVAGAFGFYALKNIVAHRLYGVKPVDPVTYVTVSLILAGIALLACLVPARRAARVDPMQALRNE